MLNTPFPPWPSYTQEEADAVSDVVLSNRTNQWVGEHTRAFEKEFAEFAGTRHAIALANGTVALDLAFVALGIGPGDDVLVTARTYIASVSSAVVAGARPVFADVDRDTQVLSVESIEAALTPATRAIVVVHLAGMPADMDSIMAFADRRGIAVIEDCAQAHGARWRGKSVGSFGRVGTWSFCQDKIMTTGGEGGMITTNDERLWRRMWAYKDHGKSYEAAFEREHPPGYRWLHESFGTNWRLTEMQSVIGRIQLGRMPAWQSARSTNAEAIRSACRDIDWLRVPDIPEHATHAAYKCYVFVRPERLPSGWSRDRIIDELYALEVPAYQGTCSQVYLEKAFDGTGFRPDEPLPVAVELGATSLMFLVHPTLAGSCIETTCESIHTVNQMIQATFEEQRRGADRTSTDDHRLGALVQGGATPPGVPPV